MRARWPLIVLILAPLAILWRCVFLGETIGPWAEVRAFAPWSEARPDRPFDVLQMDAALQFYVWRDLVFDSWRHFQVPLWNPYSFGGAPLLANSQSGALYPPHILVGVLQIPTSAGVTLLAWFHLALAGLGVYALGRRLGGSDWAACLGGVSFSLSAFMISWTGLSSVISTVAWIPWCLWACMGVWDQQTKLKSVAWLGLFVAMLLLAGHLQFAAFGLMAIILFATLGALEFKVPIRNAIWVLPGLVIGALIASPQIIAVMQWSQLSHRRAPATTEGWMAYQSSGLQWWEWASIGSGDLLGSPVRWAPGQVSSFWPALVKPGGNYAESAVTVGVVVLILGFATFFRKQRGALSLGAVALVGVLIASASPLAQALYFGFPGWSATGSPGRAGVLFVVGLCVLVAMTPEFDRENTPQPRHWALGTSLALIGSSALWTLGPALPTWLALTKEQFEPVFQAGFSLGGVAIILLSGVVLIGLASKTVYQKDLPKACMILGLIALIPGLVSAPLRTGSVPPPPAGVAPSTRVAMINRQWSMFEQPTAIMPPNLAALYRIREVGGYDSLISRAEVERLRALNGGKDPAPPENGNMMFVKDPSRITRAEADEIWTTSPDWNAKLIGRVGSIYRYAVTKPGTPIEKEKPQMPPFWGMALGVAAMIGIALRRGPKPE